MCDEEERTSPSGACQKETVRRHAKEGGFGRGEVCVNPFLLCACRFFLLRGD
jgi:hypothetical protein